MDYQEARKHLDALAIALSAAYGELDARRGEPEPVRTPPPAFAEGPLYKATPVEALAERLAKVEDRLVELRNHDSALHGRIDKVAEIIGERVSDLVNDIAELRSEVQRAHNRFDGWQEPVFPSDDIAAVRGVSSVIAAMPPELRAQYENTPAFPTGGADTAEAAAEAVLPVPQRGDRVRLEGARSLGGSDGYTGWFDVTGQAEGSFQVDATNQKARPVPHVKFTIWVANDDPGLKEVRHADHA